MHVSQVGLGVVWNVKLNVGCLVLLCQNCEDYWKWRFRLASWAILNSIGSNVAVRIRFVSDFVLGKILGSMNIMEELLQSKFVSCAILGTLQKYYRRVQGDKFLQLRGFNARYAAGMSTNGFQIVVRTMFDLLEKKSEGSITLNREYVVQLKTHFGPVSVAKLTHSNPTQRSLRKEMLSAALCEQWIPNKLEVDGDGQRIFCHPSTSALDFMSCVKCIAYGVSSMR